MTTELYSRKEELIRIRKILVSFRNIKNLKFEVSLIQKSYKQTSYIIHITQQTIPLILYHRYDRDLYRNLLLECENKIAIFTYQNIFFFFFECKSLNEKSNRILSSK